MKISRRTLLPIVVTLVAAVGLTACGSDDDSSADTDSSTTTTTTATTTTAAGAAVIETATNPEVGTILVDSEGRTVYTFTKDGAAVECTGPCRGAWPAVLLPEGTDSATGAAGVTGLGTTSVDGGEQVTVDDLPLYTFSGDAAAGEVNGNGIESFGGVWRVVVVGSAGAGTGAGTDSSTTTPTNGDADDEDYDERYEDDGY
jgi:predicted lipoprotein with Yx(FWY)xxD motif